MPGRTCLYGSQPFPGALAVAYFEAADIEVIAGLIGSPVLSAILFPFVEVAFDVATICASDPPDPPTFSASDFLNADVLLTKAKQLIQSYMWNVWCECKPPTAPLTGWDNVDVHWSHGPAADLNPSDWPLNHAEDFYFNWNIFTGPSTVTEYTGGYWFWLFKGTADVSPWANAGKPLDYTDLGSWQDHFWLHKYTMDVTDPSYIPLLAGWMEIWDAADATILLTVTAAEFLGFYGGDRGIPANPTPPSIPSTVSFPADVTADLQDIQNRIKAVEAKLDNLMMAITIDVGDPLQTITAPLPQLLPALIQAISPKQFSHWEKSYLADCTGNDILNPGTEGVLIHLGVIPDWAGQRPAIVPLFEVNTRSLQLGWIAWQEGDENSGWLWRTLDMRDTVITSRYGPIVSLEYSLADGVSGAIYTMERVNLTYGP